jgi:hypothetical protein
METDLHELLVEMLAYLNEFGQYENFLEWEEGRGYDRHQLDSDLEKLEEDYYG